MIGSGVIDDPGLRHVCKLRLAAGSEQSQRHALRVLEESLRLFSLPGEAAGKVFFFRRLQLPRLRSDESPHSYAAALEQKCQEIAQRAVHFSHASALHAECVFAWSSIEPWQALAERVAHSQYTDGRDGWFWRTALPQDALNSGSPLQVLLQVASRYGKDGVLEFLSQIEPEVLRSICEKLEVAHVDQGKLPAFCRAPDHSIGQLQVGRKLLDRLPPVWRQLAIESAARWNYQQGECDPRVRWLVAAAWLIAEPQRAMDARLPEQVQVMAEAIADEVQQRAKSADLYKSRHSSNSDFQESQESAQSSRREAPQPLSRPSSGPETLEFSASHRKHASDSAESQSPLPGRPAHLADSSLATDSELKAQVPHEQIAITQPRESNAHPEALRKGNPAAPVSTPCAGFFYCLGILDRMGIGETLAAHPELIDMNFVRHLLRELAIAAGVSVEDPVLRQELWLQSQTPAPLNETLPFSASLLPKEWRNRRSGISIWPLQRLARAWTLALRRRISRATRLSLAQVVNRPAEFIATRTHLEITFPQSSLDVGIRKAGFDMNPGWLPWLGRVVTFHYSCAVLDVFPTGGVRRNSPAAAVLSRTRRAPGQDEKSSQ